MGRKIEEIDSNLKVQTTLTEKDICFCDVRKPPFQIYGLYNSQDEPVFKRLPDSIGQTTNEGVQVLYTNTAGGRVRFTTNSPYVAIKAVMPAATIFPHMTAAGTAGFDLYVDQGRRSTYYRTFMPPVEMKDGYESILSFPDAAQRSLTINFPLYSDVHALYVGLRQGSSIDAGASYEPLPPVLYYGSSITQGGCASRPGNSYQAIIARRLNCDYINLGFSGSARGEEVIVDYMAGLKISAFVCDYDHNAPTVEHLQATHQNVYRKFRQQSPVLPIILVSKPDYDGDPRASIARRDVIYKTYIQAVLDGDSNVYFIDGQSLFKDENRDCCTVDGCHPNDAGFLRMAETIGQVVGQALSGRIV